MPGCGGGRSMLQIEQQGIAGSCACARMKMEAVVGEGENNRGGPEGEMAD